MDCKIKLCVSSNHFLLVFSSFLSCTKNYVKTPGFKASKFQVHNKYRAPLDSALLISTDKSTTWTYPSFFERSQRFERATTSLQSESQNLVQIIMKILRLFTPLKYKLLCLQCGPIQVFFERSQPFERATTALWSEFQNIVQKL